MTTNGPTTSTAIQTRPPSAQELLKHDLEKASGALAAMLPKHVTVERLIKVVLSATARNQDLLKCSRPSIIRAVMQSAELGLELGGILGEAYLVPYKRSWKDGKDQWQSAIEAQCIPGYRGFIKLARNSGQIHSIGARVVRERDQFAVNLADEKIEHHPDMSADPGQLVAVYAIARLRDGGQQVEVMSRAQVDAIRARSKAAKSGPWVTDYEEMARKTVVRRLAKYLPLSPELQRAIEVDAEHDDRERRAADAAHVIDAHFVPDAKPRGVALAEEVAGVTPHDPQTGEVLEDQADPLAGGDEAPLVETPRGREPGEEG
jgi:recombination protein RecT